MVQAFRPLHGDEPSMSSKLRSLMQPPMPAIAFKIHNPKKVWTTMDEIKGIVTVTCPTDTPVDLVEIQFVGTTRTYVERMSTAAAIAGRAEAWHQFLKLIQPNLEDCYPENHVLLAGKSYDFPFVFNVPERLLPRVCTHQVHNHTVRHAHLSLPPTFGDKDADKRQGIPSDMAPEMSSVRYGIFARVWRTKLVGDELARVSLACKARRLRVMPVTEEQAPLNIEDGDDDYTMRKSRTLRKGVLKSKTGTLTMQTSQPAPLQVGLNTRASHPGTTKATLSLRFDPADKNCQPPRLDNVSSKLKIITIFASTARQNIPVQSASFLDACQGAHVAKVGLASICVSSVEWTKHDPVKSQAPTLRRDSACSVDDENATPSRPTSAGEAYYTAHIIVPLTLPSSKHAWIPTFHTCLISRQYVLKLRLGLHSSLLGSSMKLRVPIQITCEGRTAPDPADLARSNSVVTQDGPDMDDADDFFEPRALRAPSETFVGRSRIGSQAPTDDHEAPPGYTAYAEARGSRRAASVPM